MELLTHSAYGYVLHMDITYYFLQTKRGVPILHTTANHACIIYFLQILKCYLGLTKHNIYQPRDIHIIGLCMYTYVCTFIYIF